MGYFSVSLISIFSVLVYATWRRCCKKELVEASNLAVFISGCDTGLGNHLAIYFDSLGCDVFAGCLNPIKSRSSLPDSVTVVPLDISTESSVKEAVSEVQRILKEKKKDLWALVNNAGVCVYGEFEWQTWEQCQRQVEVNFLGTMRLTKSFLPLLRISKGRIITVTSVNGSISYPGISVYSATKFALEGLSHAIRLELRRQHGIKVIIVEPGDFARLTSIMSQHERNAQEMWDNMTQDYQDQYGDFFRKYHRVTMKYYGLTSPRSIEDSPLLDNMKDALLNINPCLRYLSTGVLYRIIYRVLGILPYTVVDFVLNKVSDKLMNSDQP